MIIENVTPYRFMIQGDEKKVADLILKVFTKFAAPGYSRDGIEEFKRFVNPDAMAERFQTGNIIFLAERNDSIVGVIEIRSQNHIALLFVDKFFPAGG